MPRKTKRQKKIADIRRAILNKQIKNFSSAIISKEEKDTSKEKLDSKKINKDINTNISVKQDQSNNYEALLSAHTKSDLIKTAIIIIFIFALEFAIFYANLMGIKFENIIKIF